MRWGCVKFISVTELNRVSQFPVKKNFNSGLTNINCFIWNDWLNANSLESQSFWGLCYNDVDVDESNQILVYFNVMQVFILIQNIVNSPWVCVWGLVWRTFLNRPLTILFYLYFHNYVTWSKISEVQKQSIKNPSFVA